MHKCTFERSASSLASPSTSSCARSSQALSWHLLQVKDALQRSPSKPNPQQQPAAWQLLVPGGIAHSWQDGPALVFVTSVAAGLAITITTSPITNGDKISPLLSALSCIQSAYQIIRNHLVFLNTIVRHFFSHIVHLCLFLSSSFFPSLFSNFFLCSSHPHHGQPWQIFKLALRPLPRGAHLRPFRILSWVCSAVGAFWPVRNGAVRVLGTTAQVDGHSWHLKVQKEILVSSFSLISLNRGTQGPYSSNYLESKAPLIILLEIQ